MVNDMQPLKYKTPINTGELRNRITIHAKKENCGPIPNLDDYEETGTPVWAKVRFLRGRERWAAQAVNSEVEVEFTIRYREDIDETMAIKYNGTMYEIDAVIPADQMNMFLLITAKRLVNVGGG